MLTALAWSVKDLLYGIPRLYVAFFGEIILREEKGQPRADSIGLSCPLRQAITARHLVVFARSRS